MRRVSTTVPAPADFGIDVLAVPAGTDVDLQLRLESVVDGVLVSGTARARVAGECVRCLDALERELEVDFQELYAYAVEPDRAGSGRVGRAGHSRHDGPEPGAEEEDDVLTSTVTCSTWSRFCGNAVVLALPLAPVCGRTVPDLLCAVRVPARRRPAAHARRRRPAGGRAARLDHRRMT
jgi:uncharacterized protein